MRDNSYDRTIERNYLQKWRLLIPEYEAVKAGTSQTFRRVGDFYRHHGTCSQTFRKDYNRYLLSGSEQDLLPQRRGPKWRERRDPTGIEAEILACRNRGLNRYEIHAALRETRPDASSQTVPSTSTIHRRLREHGLNRKTKAMVEEKCRIIKTMLGEMGHVDLHQLPRDMFLQPPPQARLPGLPDRRLLTPRLRRDPHQQEGPAVMFRTLKMINTLNVNYGLRFKDILTDNGAEFASRQHPEDHSFEAMLLELGIKHRYTKPYRPQTDGKAERFWRTLNDDLIDGATFDHLEHFSNELFEYLVYYHAFRPHQALDGLTPKAFALTKAQPNRSANS